MSDSPDPFCPVIRNGYKDDAYVRFTISENAMIWMHMYDAGNTTYNTSKTTRLRSFVVKRLSRNRDRLIFRQRRGRDGHHEARTP